jgi:hypothetical protein
MSKSSNLEATRETSRLLSELDHAIDRSSVMREIVSKYEHLRSIENITGPSRLTRVMRKEIQILENRLGEVSESCMQQDSVFSLV